LRKAIPQLPHIRALLWWSVDDPRADFRVDSSTRALEVLREATASPLYQSSRKTLLTATHEQRGGR
jgi:hypothetical protein